MSIPDKIILTKETDSQVYKEIPLFGRFKLCYDWIPEGTSTLLDAGCAWGYATRFFQKKAPQTYGIDPNEEQIDIAIQRYPGIRFFCCGLESTPFDPDFFDTVILCDVLEHVNNELQSLNEIFRILRPGGTLIITTMNKGLFTFLDPLNYGYYIAKYAPWLYRWVYNIENENEIRVKPEHTFLHRHYSVKDLVALLDNSRFKNNYTMEKIFRSGTCMWALIHDLDTLLSVILGKKLTTILLKPLSIVWRADFWIPLGSLSFNIAIKIQKKNI